MHFRFPGLSAGLMAIFCVVQPVVAAEGHGTTLQLPQSADDMRKYMASGDARCPGCGVVSNIRQVEPEDLGGRSLANPFYFTGSAVLAPRNPGASHNEFDANTNPCAIRHLDPATGQVLTEYPVEDVDCIELNGHFLCGASTYFSGGLPIVYDTNARTRVL